MNRRMPSLVSFTVGLLLALLITLAAPFASAGVRHEGAWPAQEKPVSLSLKQTPRAEAVKKLAIAAGWNVIVNAPPGDLIDVEVKDESPSKILDVLLKDRSYVAVRDGKLLSIDIDDAAAPVAAAAPVSPVAPPAMPAPPAIPSNNAAPSPAVSLAIAPSAAAAPNGRVRPAERGKDRNVTGSHVTIGKDEVVQDVVVFGGPVDVYGIVTGDISVSGSDLHIHDTAWIMGDASVIVGNLTIDGESAIDGDVSVMGGTLKRSDRCKIGGDVEARGPSGDDHGSNHLGDHGKDHSLHVSSILGGIGGAITRAAMLFVFGAVLLALATKRMEALRVEVATRPMRSFAMGVVGVFGAVVLFVAFCVTVIGIPIALVGLFLGVIGGYAGVCAVLTVVGQALLKHKTESPYVQLAVGCAIFMVVGAIPFVGNLVTIAIALVGIGVLVATRAAGLLPKRNGAPASGPYRTPAEV